MMVILLAFLIPMQAHGALQIWKAEKSVELSSSQMAIDGGSAISLKCPHQTKAIAGTLELNRIPLEVSCYDDYMGGFFVKDELIAQKDGDAGEAWETQSLLFFDVASKSLILSIKAYSIYDNSLDCEGSTKEALQKTGLSDKKIAACLAGEVKCKTSEKLKKWNPTSKRFVETNFSGRIPTRRLWTFGNSSGNCK